LEQTRHVWVAKSEEIFRRPYNFSSWRQTASYTSLGTSHHT